jgi:hypothetical protein
MENMSLDEFRAHFNTEDSCVDYLFQIKWPHGFVCPCCGHRDAYHITTRRLPLYECRQCNHQTSLIKGTIMEGSRTDLCKWLVALFLVSRPHPGISARQLSVTIKVTYKTAWLILHKIRHAMKLADASVQLSGLIQVNDAFYGRRPQSTSRRRPQEHPLLVGATTGNLDIPIYVKMKLVPKKHLDDKLVLPKGTDEFMEKHAEPNPQHIEFCLGPYKPKKYKRLSPFFSAAKRWINDTFHGLGARHLDTYLTEFCYRLNQRILQKGIFDGLTNLCMKSPSISYRVLTTF